MCRHMVSLGQNGLKTVFREIGQPTTDGIKIISKFLTEFSNKIDIKWCDTYKLNAVIPTMGLFESLMYMDRG